MIAVKIVRIVSDENHCIYCDTFVPLTNLKQKLWTKHVSIFGKCSKVEHVKNAIAISQPYLKTFL